MAAATWLDGYRGTPFVTYDSVTLPKRGTWAFEGAGVSVDYDDDAITFTFSGGGGGGVTWADDLVGSSDTSQVVSGLTGASNKTVVRSTSRAIEWASATTTPSLSQAALVGATGAALTIQAQNATTTGGELVLTSGTGATAGDVTIKTGGVTKFQVSASSVSIVPALWTWSGSGSNILINHATTGAASGNSLTVQAQNAATTGGLIAITSGTGSTAANAGTLDLQTGAVSRMLFSGTDIRFGSGTTNPSKPLMFYHASQAFSPGQIGGTLGNINFPNVGAATWVTHTLSNGIAYPMLGQDGDVLHVGGFVQATQIDGSRVMMTNNAALFILNRSGASNETEISGAYHTFCSTNFVEALRLTSASAGANTMQWASTVASVAINTADVATNSATGIATSFRGQNATGTSARGGLQTLGGGTGTLAYGTLAVASPIAVGYLSKPMADADQTLTAAESANNFLKVSGAMTGDHTLTFACLPTAGQMKFIQNTTTGGFNVTVLFSTGTGLVIPAGKHAVVFGDGTNAIGLTMTA